MPDAYLPKEHHYSQRTGWLRASVLGANDGIVSTASLMIGVASAETSASGILVAGMAGLVAGAMSMAAGEFVSVSSQADTEKADLEIERAALQAYPEEELEELTQIYIDRGVEPVTARAVAEQLSRHDALSAHARDEIGLTEVASANPIQAAWSSAASFSAGAILPLIAAALAPANLVTTVVAVVSLLSLAVLGWLSAKAGGAGCVRAVVRVVFWGAAAMIVTGLIGAAFGTVV
ncbi:VIT family protein [Hyphomonas sp. WL0036]|uniref:VIT1/CCC1 transporter family protein n=1 Tax=Hyphomonas sediminis TaxID=2866160 RepID=UPI001C7EA119|nr:VIT family protein [Hyphomonas sediminis]MBY9068388.1 VIT family protein [Hyphomonas sediminis]